MSCKADSTPISPGDVQDDVTEESMNAKEYLQKAEKPRLILIDADGFRSEMNLKNVERPSLKSLRDVCTRNVSFGRVSFLDTFEITSPRTTTISRAILYYDDIQVALREFPDILLYKGDGLLVKFDMTIVIDHSQVTLGE